jgi:hypothetical protein
MKKIMSTKEHCTVWLLQSLRLLGLVPITMDLCCVYLPCTCLYLRNKLIRYICMQQSPTVYYLHIITSLHKIDLFVECWFDDWCFEQVEVAKSWAIQSGLSSIWYSPKVLLIWSFIWHDRKCFHLYFILRIPQIASMA